MLNYKIKGMGIHLYNLCFYSTVCVLTRSYLIVGEILALAVITLKLENSLQYKYLKVTDLF